MPIISKTHKIKTLKELYFRDYTSLCSIFKNLKNDKKLGCLIAGSTVVGVGLALMASYSKTSTEVLEVSYKWMGSFDDIISLVIFGGLALLLWRFIIKR